MKTLVLSVMMTASLLATAIEYKPGPDGVIRNPDGTPVLVPVSVLKTLPESVRKAQGQAVKLFKIGPTVEKPGVGKGCFKFICCTDKISSSDVKESLEAIERIARINMNVAEGKTPSPKQAKSALKDYQAEAGIYVIDDDDLPRILLAPEDGWAMVNVAALSVDNPDRAKLVKRTNVELVRAFSFICSSSNDARSALMSPVGSLSDLDEFQTVYFAAFNGRNTVKALENFGIVPRVITSYLTACRQGWAHQPTNETERIIWDRVHSEKERGPVNGLKIQPPKK